MLISLHRDVGQNKRDNVFRVLNSVVHFFHRKRHEPYHWGESHFQQAMFPSGGVAALKWGDLNVHLLSVSVSYLLPAWPWAECPFLHCFLSPSDNPHVRAWYMKDILSWTSPPMDMSMIWAKYAAVNVHWFRKQEIDTVDGTNYWIKD